MASDNTREQILQAAGPIFAGRGFARATVREICAAAKVNLAAINYYFGDKKQLYIETVRTAHRRRAAEVPLPCWEQGAPAHEKLRGHVRTLIRRMIVLEDAPWENRLLTREVLEPTEACRALVEEHFRPHFEQLVALIGEFLPPDTSEQVKKKYAFSLIGQCFFYRAAGSIVSLLVPAVEMREHFTVEALSDHIAETMLGALAGASPNQAPSAAGVGCDLPTENG